MTKKPLPPLPADPAPEADPPSPTSMPTPSAPQAWHPVARPARTAADSVRTALLATAVAVLVISVAIAYFSANSIVSIWFEEQWVPVARLGLAVVVAAVAGWAIVRLTRKRTA